MKTARDMDLPSTLDKVDIIPLLNLPQRALFVWLHRVRVITFATIESRQYFISQTSNTDVSIIRTILPHIDSDVTEELIANLDHDLTYGVMGHICNYIQCSTIEKLTLRQNLVAMLLRRISMWAITDTDIVLDAMIKSQLDKNNPPIFELLENRNGLGEMLMRQKLNPRSDYYYWDSILWENLNLNWYN